VKVRHNIPEAENKYLNYKMENKDNGKEKMTGVTQSEIKTSSSRVS
jgi:hypothetical protein